MDKCELEFTDEAIAAIAAKASERKTGARGLRSIMENLMRDIMFELPSNPDVAKVIITEDNVKNGTKPEVVLKTKKTKVS